MKRRLQAFVLIALAVLAVSVGSALAARVVKVGASANGKTIGLHVRDVLVVTLRGNASAGFSWRVRTLKRTIVKFVRRTYVPGSGVGAGGKYVLRFRAVGVGTTPLKLVYVQSGHTKAAKTFRLTLVVKAPPPPA